MTLGTVHEQKIIRLQLNAIKEINHVARVWKFDVKFRALAFSNKEAIQKKTSSQDERWLPQEATVFESVSFDFIWC